MGGGSVLSNLTDILKGIANYQRRKSGITGKGSKALFEKKIKDMYYNSSEEKKKEMKEGFE